jgi:tRNA nucleotidyltransferase/poly(A) polymerase
VPHLEDISNERKRDEIIRLFEQGDVGRSVDQMFEVGIIDRIFPEATKLADIDLDLPHTHNAWVHTLHVADYCQQLMKYFLKILTEANLHPHLSQACEVLDQHRDDLYDFLHKPINVNRSKLSLMMLACLYHDTGKGVISAVFKDGRKRFPKHAKIGSELIRRRMRVLGFSKKEIDYLSKVVRYHMKPSQSEFINSMGKDLHIHRFFRKSRAAGILVGFIHLADVLATYEETITEERWSRAVSSVGNIFDAFFNRYDEVINPPRIINGKDLMNKFGLPPGKKIGALLEQVAEAQVVGLVNHKKDAFEFVNKMKNKG